MTLTLGGFLAVTTALTAVLGVMVTVRKLRRDRREHHHAGHRAELRAALLVGGNDLDQLLHRAARRPRLQIDLAAVLPGMIRKDGEWVIRCVRAAAETSGLARSLERRIRSHRPAVRGTAALLIGHLRMIDGTLLVRPLLRDRDGDVRLVAAGALANIGTGQAADALVDGLVRRVLAPERLVERLGARWAVPAVLSRLLVADADDDAALRSSLARALGLAADERAEPALLELLASPELEVRVNAARALATCGSERSEAALVDALRHDDWEVRAQAASSLGALGATNAVSALAENLGHQAWWVRANAATALGRLGHDGEHALREAADGSDRYASERAVEVLALIGAAV